MKTIITLLLICLSTIMTAQEEQFTISINTEPGAFEDGFNIGADIEIHQKWFYIGGGVYLFPNLNDLPYSQLHFVSGLNYRFQQDKIEDRLYLGVIAGFNQRNYKGTYVLMGLESGYEHYFGNLGVGAELQYIHRTDVNFYGGNNWNYNGAIKLIYRF